MLILLPYSLWYVGISVHMPHIALSLPSSRICILQVATSENSNCLTRVTSCPAPREPRLKATPGLMSSAVDGSGWVVLRWSVGPFLVHELHVSKEWVPKTTGQAQYTEASAHFQRSKNCVASQVCDHRRNPTLHTIVCGYIHKTAVEECSRKTIPHYIW